jgi:AcrR family transcriptional regulator
VTSDLSLSILETIVSIKYILAMGRVANDRRPEELLEAIVNCLAKKGLRALSLRPLARDVGSSPRVLLYYFGSKEQLTAKVFERVRRMQQSWIDAVPGAALHETCTRMWQRMIRRDQLPWSRLFFEVYAQALAQPEEYEEFLKQASADWIGKIAKLLEHSGCTHGAAQNAATAILAGFRGFMLDYCATHDRTRIQNALQFWACSLDSHLEHSLEKGID